MATAKLMTIDDLWEIEEPGRYDVIRGELHAMAPAGGEHGKIGIHIAARLWNHVHPSKLGEVFNSDTGFILSQDPLVWLSPDVSFVREDRLPSPEDQVGFLRLAPDLVVEIVSPSDRSALVTEKVMQYLAAGTQLVWVVEPRVRVVTVYTADRDAHVYTEVDELDGGEVLPEFRVRVSDIFE